MPRAAGNFTLQGCGRQPGALPGEAQAPVADAFVTDHHAAGSEDRLNVTQAEAEAVVQPDRVLNDLGRKAKAVVGIGRARHAHQAATSAKSRQPDNAC
jgi:hypothetical protein